jgi:FKBP-type peptidyl-prolyl cis-trans isomerase SlyD
MQVEKDRVVSIEYVLKDDDGKVLDQSGGRGPLEYLHGHGNIIDGLENVLAGKSAGDSFEATVEPVDGYGVRDDARVFEVPKSELGPQVTPQKGMVLTMTAPSGTRIPVTVVKVKLDSVVLDGNHQLAGKRLHFTGSVSAVRKATKDELAHRHAHGAHGHGH